MVLHTFFNEILVLGNYLLYLKKINHLMLLSTKKRNWKSKQNKEENIF